MTHGEGRRLYTWLERYHLLSKETQRLLTERPTTRVDQGHQLRLLNDIESRFDEIMATDLVPPLDWHQIREELGLAPSSRNPWLYIGARAHERFEALGYPLAQVERAERVWRDFLVLQEGQVKPLQVPTGWVAALDYLLQHLYFSTEATQQDFGDRYGVSASTVGLRFRAIVDTVGLVLFDHPSRKRLAATKALTVDQGQMSDEEFHERLLRGQFRVVDDSSTTPGGT